MDGWDENPSDSNLGENSLYYIYVPLELNPKDYNPNVCLDDTLAL